MEEGTLRRRESKADGNIPAVSYSPPNVASTKSTPKDHLSMEARSIFEKYPQILYGKREDEYGPKVKVGSTLSSLAFFYERVRNTIDYREDQTLLRSSIERITKRLLWENPSKAIDTVSLSESLVKELIWAKYIKNNTLPQSSIETIAAIFTKYLRLLSLISDNKQKIGNGISWRDWVLGVCAGEIEEVIRPELTRFDILTNEVTSWFLKRYEWEDKNIDEGLKKVYIWASVYRSLLKSDLPSLRYHILKRFFHKWSTISVAEIDGIKADLVLIARKIEYCLASRDHIKLYRIMQKLTPSFTILSEIAEENDENLIRNQNLLEKEIQRICTKKYNEIQGRVTRGITRSIIYIFISKIILALIIEIPYEMFILGGVRYIPISINLTLPPFLMFVVGLMIKKPGEGNTKKITEKIFDFVYDGDVKKIGFTLADKKRRGVGAWLFDFLYAILFVLILGVISYFLFKLGFSAVSAMIFFMFLSLILLFGFKVKYTASEFNVVGDDEEFLTNMVSIIFLPFLNIGYWLSGQLAKINFLVLILDFLIEAPLKNILAVLEDWNIFMLKKREELVDNPNI